MKGWNIRRGGRGTDLALGFSGGRPRYLGRIRRSRRGERGASEATGEEVRGKVWVPLN